MPSRFVHYTLKISDRSESRNFYVDQLGMKVLRHEEYDNGCSVECNGPFKNKWSKTLIGYGSEDKNFVLELVYNYDVTEYERGNDFLGCFLESTNIYNHCVQRLLGQVTEINDTLYLRVVDPDGRNFYIRKGTSRSQPIFQIGLRTTNMPKTLDYWTNVIGMNIQATGRHRCAVGFDNDNVLIEWLQSKGKVERGNAYGRIAFSTETYKVVALQKKVEKEKETVLFPIQEIGSGEIKETVLILADPNQHEICIVGEKEFLMLAQEDKGAERKLLRAIEDEAEAIYAAQTSSSPGTSEAPGTSKTSEVAKKPDTSETPEVAKAPETTDPEEGEKPVKPTSLW